MEAVCYQEIRLLASLELVLHDVQLGLGHGPLVAHELLDCKRAQVRQRR